MLGRITGVGASQAGGSDCQRRCPRVGHGQRLGALICPTNWLSNLKLAKGLKLSPACVPARRLELDEVCP